MHKRVSIRLMSPASGDCSFEGRFYPVEKVSIRLMSPASGDIHLPHHKDRYPLVVSIRLMSPASGDPCILNHYPARSLEAVSEVQKKRWLKWTLPQSIKG